MHDAPQRDVDVAIVGYGPVGATAANFLGKYGIDVVVIERDPDVYPRARAISTDEEVLRVWQQVGLAERLKQDMLGERPIDFVDGKGRSFMGLAPAPQGNNHPSQMFIYQPVVDEVIRQGVERYADHVELLLEHEMRDLHQDADGVTLDVTDLRDGSTMAVRARWVLACDGGSSRTRGLLGIGFEGKTYVDPWLVIDTKVLEPWPEVDRLRFHCDPERPAVDCPTPLGHHRWEFPILPGEDREALNTEASIWRLLNRQGITSRQVQLLRSAVYVHHVRYAERWREGRVFLLGDAAHAMPPWIGQGMASGVRDAGNLCWKLAGVVRGELGEHVLDSYAIERRPHVKALTGRAIMFGRIITERRRPVAAVRNVVVAVGMKLPFLGRWVRDARWMVPMSAPRDGFVAEQPASVGAVGGFVPQPWVATEDADRVRLDDVLGGGWAIVARQGAAGLAAETRERWEDAGATVYWLTALQPKHGELRDLDGTLTAWMDKRGAQVVALRPDRIVYAAGGPGVDLSEPPRALRAGRKAVTA